jgi:hypothetical protein
LMGVFRSNRAKAAGRWSPIKIGVSWVVIFVVGARGSVVCLKHYATKRKVAGSRPDEVDFFKFTSSFRSHYGAGVDSTSNRSEYQEF